jgi:hypothetical protein
MWLRIGTSSWLLWTPLWTFGFRKRQVIYWLAQWLLASQEGLCSMKLTAWLDEQNVPLGNSRKLSILTGYSVTKKWRWVWKVASPAVYLGIQLSLFTYRPQKRSVSMKHSYSCEIWGFTAVKSVVTWQDTSILRPEYWGRMVLRNPSVDNAFSNPTTKHFYPCPLLCVFLSPYLLVCPSSAISHPSSRSWFVPRQFPGSILGPETEYSETSHGVPQSLHANVRIVPSGTLGSCVSI